MRRRGICGPLFLALVFAVVACLVFASLAAVLVLRGEVPLYAPRLTGFEPQPGSAFRPTTSVTLAFDQPMDAASVEAAFSLEPPVAGTFDWSSDHTRVTFVPAGAGYEPGTQYTAHLAAGAQAAMFSRRTARAVEWRFSLPPLLQSSSPPVGAMDVGASPLLQVEANYPLDCRPTLKTLAVEPKIQGLLRCQGRMVVFRPTSPLEPGRAYAASLAHLFLEGDPNPRPGVRWEFQTAAPLSIEEVDPVAQALVADPWSEVRIHFNRPVVADSLLSRFSLLAEDGERLGGQVRWEAGGSAFVFQPDGPLLPESHYRIRLEAGVGDELGFTLDQPLDVPFTTLGLLELPEPIPGTEGVALDSRLRIPFTRPMDKPSVEAGLTFTPTLEGAVTWEGDTLVFVPRGGLAGDTSYTVRLSPKVRDATGVPLSRRRQWPFRTEPFLLEAQVPSGRNVRQLQQPVELTFALPMDAGSVAASLSISPTTPAELLWSDDRRRATYQPEPGWYSGVEYQVVLSGRARTANGLQSLGQDVAWDFATAAAEVDFGAGPNAQVMDAAGPGAFQLLLRGANVADFRLYPLTRAQFLELYDTGIPTTGWQQAAISATLGLTPTVAWREVVTPLDESTPLAGWSPVEGHLPGDLTPGLYLLSGGPEPAEVLEETNRHLLMALTRHALVLKRALAGSGSQSEAQVLAWATELGSGTPVVSATVQLYDRAGNILAEGTTDGQGLLALDLPGEPPPWLALAEAGGDLTVCGFGPEWGEGAWWGWGDLPDGRPLYLSYGYTDRPIYRPGQQIHYKEWIRADDDASYRLPAPDLSVTLRLRDARDNLVATQVLTPTAFGTLSGTLQLADETTLGTWHLETDVAGTVTSHPFQVEEYRKPEYEVLVGTPQRAFVQGEMVSVTVASTYYAGQPTAGAEVVLQVYPAYAEEDYGEGAPWFGAPLHSEEGVLDAAGRWATTLPTEGLFDPGGLDERLLLALEATVDDGVGQPVSSYQLVTLHRAAQGLSLLLERQGYEPGEEISFGARLLDLDGKPVPGAEITARVMGWDDAEVAADSTTTDETGHGHFVVSLAEQGWYRLVVAGTDRSVQQISAEDWLWVYDPKGQAPQYQGRWGTERALSVGADRPSYAVGDEARLVVHAAAPGPALLTLERGEIRYVQSLSLISGTNLITLAVRADFAPNVQVTVNQFGPFAPETGAYGLNVPDAELRTASTQLLVPQAGRQLTVTVEPDRQSYAPGDDAVLGIRVVDAVGQPVTAEVSLSVVDEAIYALAEDQSEDPFAAFYAPRPNLVRTLDSLRPIRWPLPGWGTGGGESEETGVPRRNFLDTAYWAPALVTDENGEAVATVQLPDNVTEWRVLARAVTTDTLVGQATARLVTQQELVVRLSLPPFVIAGDALTVTAQIQSSLSEPVSATVRISLEGLALEADAGDRVQVVHVPAGGSALIHWPAAAVRPAGPLAQAEGQARVRLSAVATQRGTRLAGRDAVEVTLPVILPLVTEVTTSAGELMPAGASETMTITVPADALPDLTRLQISLAPSLVAGLLEGVEYLVDYPHGCVEQTMSQVVPNAVVGRALREQGRLAQLGEVDLPAMVALGLQKLYGYQHEDGGWGWWYDDDTNLDQTAYVLFGLALTEQAGFEVDDGVLQRGGALLRRELPSADAATQAFGAYALSLAGQPLTATLTLTEALALAPFSQAALALAWDAAGDAEAAAILLDELGGAAVHEGVMTHWQAHAAVEAQSMGSDVRTTAMVAEALMRLDPEFAAPIPPAGGEGTPQERTLLPRAVRWLVQQRQGAGWGDTQRTSYALLALSDYLLASQPSTAAVNYQVYGGDLLWAEGELASASASHSLVLTYSHTLSPALLVPGENTIRLALGPGEPAPGERLTYDATWQVQRSFPDDGVAALATHDRSINLAREYRLPGRSEAVTRVQRGDLVEVSLTLDVPAESWYVIVEDPLPAGLQALNERLGTTSHQAAAYDQPAFSWQELGYNRKEVNDERVTFFVTRLEPGRHVVEYLARAVTSGDFLALPAEVYLMYEPQVWARSESSRFQIR